MIVDVLMSDAFEQTLHTLSLSMRDIIFRKIRLLAENPGHPSLNTHRLHQVKANIWDCYISDSIRLLYEIKKGTLHLWDLGAHSIVDNVHLRGFAANTRFSRMDITPEESAMPAQVEPKNPQFVPSAVRNTVPITPLLPQKGSPNRFTFFQNAHLRVLGVPAHLVQPLKKASSLEEALAISSLPEQTRLWLEELSTSSELEEVMFDSSRLLYRSTLNRLEGYCEGKIKRLMLNLQRPEQQQYVDMERVPLILLKGAAGSGKTTVGVYRAIRLAEQGRRVLMVTYNRTLASVTKSLIEELIGPLPNELHVTHLHKFMMLLLIRRLRKPNMDSVEKPQLPRLLEDALNDIRKKKTAAVLNRDREFFQEEIKRVIKGLGLKSVEEYKEVERYGRKTALSARQREVVWEVYEAYQRRLAQIKLNDWSDIALLTLQTLQDKPFDEPFDDIIVDEAQDLVPVDLNVIQQLVGPGSSIMILADAAQTLYSRGFSWKQEGAESRFVRELSGKLALWQ